MPSVVFFNCDAEYRYAEYIGALIVTSGPWALREQILTIIFALALPKEPR